MKQNQNQNTINLDGELELQVQPDYQTGVFTIVGDAEAVMPIAEHVQALDARSPRKAAQKLVEAAVAVPSPKPEYLNLGELDDRTAARLALKCFVRDMKNLGRTNKYQEFVAKRKAEQDLAFDMEVGLVDRVHCRLHERMLKG